MQPFWRDLLRASVAVLLVLAATRVLGDISVSPISATLDPLRARSHLLVVSNPGNRTVPVKVSAAVWSLDREGRDVREPTRDLVLFPGQFLLAPGERRSVRVAPRDMTALPTERSYRVIVRELPIDLDGAQPVQTGVRLVSSYATAFYILPREPHSDLHLHGVERDGDTVVFTIGNSGNVHSHLRKLRLSLRQRGRTLVIDDPSALPRFYGENLLAGHVRQFRWQLPATGAVDTHAPLVVRLSVHCEYCDDSPWIAEVPVSSAPR